MSNLLKEKCTLAKIRAELEGRRGRLCRYCKGFRHLAQNCRNRKEGEKETEMPQNKFEVLKSRVMQCGVEERRVRSIEVVGVECFKCGEKGHKCRQCPLWEKEVKRVAHPIEGKAHQQGERKVAYVAMPQKVQQKRRPAHPEKEKAQDREERQIRRLEEKKAARPEQEKTQQE